MGKKTKIVPDTNIYISAIGWKGKEKEIIAQCIDGKYEYYISKQIFDELLRVMNYPKFSFTDLQKERFISALLDTVEVIGTLSTIEVVKEDPEDDKFLECAVAASVDFIVTGDPHLLKLRYFQDIEILGAHSFLERMKKE